MLSACCPPPWVSVCTHLYYLNYKCKIIFINREFIKKEKIEKKKNTNKYCSFQNFEKLLCVEGKLGGGFEKGPPIKKKGLPPPCLDD